MNNLNLSLRPEHDVEALAATYAAEGMVRIERLFPDNIANQIYDILRTQTPWRVVHSNAQGAHEIYRPKDWKALSPTRQQNIRREIYARAQKGFAYFYQSYPMISAYINGEDPGWPLHTMTAFLNSPEIHAFAKTITNEPNVRKIDAQATLYAPGHFLNTHDDTGTSAERRAAYVMGFSKEWRPDWGGKLLFLDGDEILRGFAPSFNTLTLFKTPRPHVVTQVTNFAGRGRYAITGWLRDDI